MKKEEKKMILLRRCAYQILFFLFLIYSGCVRPENVLRVAVTVSNDVFDPIMLPKLDSCYINWNIFETLLLIEYDTPTPVLAENWYWQGDSLFVVNIKENIRFSTNALLTPEDVYRSFERALHHPKSALKSYSDYVDRFFVEGKSLYIYYNNFDYIFDLLSQVPIYNANMLKSFNDDSLWQYPLSTGMYYLYSRMENKVVLKLNIYHRDFSPRTYKHFDVVEVYFEKDIIKQYQMLLNDEVDFIFQLPISAYNDVLHNSNFSVYEIASCNMLIMLLDTESINSEGINLYVNPLRDKRVRRAIAHSIDITSFVSDVLFDKANILAIPCFWNVQGYPVDRDYYPFDVEYSRQLMNEAGFGNGFEMGIRVYESEFTVALAELLKESLKAINIDVKIDLITATSFTTFPSKEGNISAILVEKYLRDDVSLEVLLSDIFYFPRSETRGHYNLMNYSDSRIIELLDVLYDMKQFDSTRMELYKRLTDVIYDEAYVIPFFQPIDIFVSNNRVKFHFKENFNFTNFKVR